MSLLSLGKLLAERRGGMGVREFARDVGISPATLSRIENGKLPDLETFSKICLFLKLDPAKILQVPLDRTSSGKGKEQQAVAAMHFKADAQLDPQAAEDLGALILAAEGELRRWSKS
jgi:transcriptional regulator with XRE-family HTH domain